MRNEKGLTLIEVLVATAILAAVVGSLLVLISQHTRQAAALEDRMLARVAAENALTLYVTARDEGAAADVRGDVELSGRSFFYEISRQQAPIQGLELVTSQARVGRDGQVLASLTTLRPADMVVAP